MNLKGPDRVLESEWGIACDKPKTEKVVQDVGGKGERASAVVTLLESFESTSTSKAIRNFGRPPEDFGIAIVTEARPFSDMMPECAESTEDPWVWFYNYPAIGRLIEKWIRIHSEKSFLAYIEAIPGDAEAKARMMTPEGESFPGYRSADDGKVYHRGTNAIWWAIPSYGSANRRIFLARGNFEAYLHSSNRRFGFLVPLLSDEE